MFTPPPSPEKRFRSPPLASRGAEAVVGGARVGRGAHSPVAKVSEPGSSFQRKDIPWDRFLAEALKPWLTRLGTQLRRLELQSAFSGLGTHALVWQGLKQAGLRVDVFDRAGAEPKSHANKFTAANDLMAQHHFLNIEHLTTGGPCLQCRSHCPPPGVRPDLYIAGFPCQPFSPHQKQTMRPEEHQLFRLFLRQFAHLRHTQPRTAALENSVGSTPTTAVRYQGWTS